MKSESLFLSGPLSSFWATIGLVALTAIVAYPFADKSLNPFLLMTAETFYQQNLPQTENSWLESFLQIQSKNSAAEAADLVLSLESGNDKALPANILTFTVTCQNRGTVTAEDVKFGLSFPKQLSYVLDTSGAYPGQNSAGLVWSLGNIKAGEEKTFHISMLADKPNPAGGQFITVAAFVKTNSLEKNFSNNKDSKDLFLFPLSDIAKTPARILTHEQNYHAI